MWAAYRPCLVLRFNHRSNHQRQWGSGAVGHCASARSWWQTEDRSKPDIGRVIGSAVMRRLTSCLFLASRAQGLAATLDQARPIAASSIALDVASTSGRDWLCLRGHQQGISTSTAAAAAIGGSSQRRVKQAEAAEAGEPALIRVVLRQAGVWRRRGRGTPDSIRTACPVYVARQPSRR